MKDLRIAFCLIGTCHLALSIACGGGGGMGSGSPAPAAPPSGLFYSSTSPTFRLGGPIRWDVPSYSGGSPTSYSIAPVLPVGLGIDPNTGVISGTPTLMNPSTTYTVTGSNSGGSTQCTLVVTVKDAAPNATIFAQDKVFYNETGLKASVPAASGMTYQWSFIGGTATGSVTAGATSNMVAYSTGANPGSYQLAVTVQNRSGESATSTRTLGVVAGQFLRSVHTPDQRWEATSIVLQDGRVLVTGGRSVDVNGTSPSQVILATTDLYDPYTDTWRKAGDMLVGRVNHAAALLPDGKVLVAGGYAPNYPSSSSEIYDPVTDSWRSASSMAYERINLTMTLLPTGKVLAVGGSSLSSATQVVELYDPTTNTWTSSPNKLHTYHSGHTATLLQDGRVFITGGDTSSSSSTPVAEVYDPLVDLWRIVQGTDIQGLSHTATLLKDGHVFVTGGGYGPYYWTSRLFDPTSMTWSSAALPQVNRSFHTANLLPDGRVLVAGGTTASTSLGYATSSVEIYDPSSDSWSYGPALAVSRQQHFSANLPDGSILIGGGLGPSENRYLASPELFDPVASRWSGMGEMTEGRLYHSATLLHNGKILVTGGIPSRPEPVSVITGGVFSSTTLFDPASRTWSPGAPMLTARALHSATLLPNGKLFVAGGFGNSSDPYAPLFLSSCEIYDPSTGIWTPTASMSRPRANHGAVLLTDGRVLVIGGTGQTNTGTDSFEIYDPSSDTWSTKQYSGYLGFVFPSAVLALPNDKVLVSVVTQSSWERTAVYDASNDSWTYIDNVDTGFPIVEALLPNNLALELYTILGPTLVEGSKLYDPVTGNLSTGGSMSARRDGMGVALLSNGGFIATGGKDLTTGQYLSSSEWFDYTTDQWSSYFSLNAPRSHHSVIQVNDLAIIVFGGGNSYVTEIGKP